MKRKADAYSEFEAHSEHSRQILRQEELIVEVTEALVAALDQASVTRTELAHRLGKSKGYVSQLLGGGRNLTLRTLANVAEALGCGVNVSVEPWGASRPHGDLDAWKSACGQLLPFPAESICANDHLLEIRIEDECAA